MAEEGEPSSELVLVDDFMVLLVKMLENLLIKNDKYDSVADHDEKCRDNLGSKAMISIDQSSMLMAKIMFSNTRLQLMRITYHGYFSLSAVEELLEVLPVESE